jgi:hypothetical protein|tara:strand:- start:223 stop:588 length:366 start_codon:yes stop_codon:yes gene_type:complete
MTFQIIRETPKALRLDDGEVTFWVQRRWLRDNGTLTPKGEEARAKAQNGEPKAKPYLKCRYRDLRAISEKAVVVDCFDGSSAVLPTSQIKESLVEDSILVPLWLAEKKDLQFASKKIWLEN